ncbi:hypothetical protein GW17_00037473 [Ensete ventricosum]|nr:hypothetical protein GW17_00037473 [Ensete ventricosum]
MRTSRYRAVLPKGDRQRSISTVGDRLRRNRERKKKKKRKRRKKKKRKRKGTSSRPRPRAVAARALSPPTDCPRAVAAIAARGQFFSPREEKRSRRPTLTEGERSGSSDGDEEKNNSDGVGDVIQATDQALERSGESNDDGEDNDSDEMNQQIQHNSTDPTPESVFNELKQHNESKLDNSTTMAKSNREPRDALQNDASFSRTGRRGGASFTRAGRRGDTSFSRVGRRGNALSLLPHAGMRQHGTSREEKRRRLTSFIPRDVASCGETSDLTVPPDSGQSVYRYSIGPVCTARTKRYSSKFQTLCVSIYAYSS